MESVPEIVRWRSCKSRLCGAAEAAAADLPKPPSPAATSLGCSFVAAARPKNHEDGAKPRTRPDPTVLLRLRHWEFREGRESGEGTASWDVDWCEGSPQLGGSARGR